MQNIKAVTSLPAICMSPMLSKRVEKTDCVTSYQKCFHKQPRCNYIFEFQLTKLLSDIVVSERKTNRSSSICWNDEIRSHGEELDQAAQVKIKSQIKVTQFRRHSFIEEIDQICKLDFAIMDVSSVFSLNNNIRAVLYIVRLITSSPILPRIYVSFLYLINLRL